MAKYLKTCFNGVVSSEERLKMVAGVFYIPKDDPRHPQGGDANFICKEKQTIGVADGVGRSDTGYYARELMNNSVNALNHELKRNVDPKRVLLRAYVNNFFSGSSTACIVTLKGCQLHAVNVGDSGFMLFRDKKLIYQSPVQVHSFNCPYQLGLEYDRPNSCEEIKVDVEAGDIVILATDGLFDNMYSSEIEELLKEETREGLLPEQLARTIAEMASSYSQNKDRISPFAKAAEEAGKSFTGGKVDDITVVVGLIESTKA